MSKSSNTTLIVALLLFCGAVGAAIVFKPGAKTNAPKVGPSADPLAGLGLEKRFAHADPGGKAYVDKLVRKRQKSTKSNPKKLAFWILLGRAWIRKARVSSDPGFYMNANACAKIALKLAPDNPLALNLRGLVYLNNHSFRKARDLAKKILEQDENSLLALGTLSDAYLELGKYKKAADAAQKMLNLKPNLPSYSRGSYIMWLQANTKGAKKAIALAFDAGKAARDREPAAWTLVQAAIYFWHEGDYKGADFGLKMTLRYYRDYAPALVERGRIAIAQRRFGDAIPLLKAALEKRPLAETAWLLGDAYTGSNQTKKAQKAYAQTIAIGRRSDPRTLSLFYSTKGRNPKEALKLARQEAKKRQGIYTLDALAWALYRNKQYKKALLSSDLANRLQTPDARLWAHAGAIRIALGQTRRGKALLQQALKRNPQFDMTGAAEARKLLESLSPSSTPSRPTSAPTSRPTPRR